MNTRTVLGSLIIFCLLFIASGFSTLQAGDHKDKKKERRHAHKDKKHEDAKDWFAKVRCQHKKNDWSKKQWILNKYDENGNGKLDADEEIKYEEDKAKAKEARKAKMEARKAKMLERFDIDGDGELSKDERKAMNETLSAERQERIEAKKQKLLEKFDADGNGELNGEEIQAAREALCAGHKHHKKDSDDHNRHKNKDKDSEK